MKAEYQRDHKYNYLILNLDQTPDEASYSYQMAIRNEIPGLVRMQQRTINGNSRIYYEISGMRDLKTEWEEKLVTAKEIRWILSAILTVQETLRGYLLDADQILLYPEYIFHEPLTGQLFFCFYPCQDQKVRVRHLAEYILTRLDHKEPEAVAIGYHFYRRASEKNFSLPETLREVLSGKRKEQMPSLWQETDLSKRAEETRGEINPEEAADRIDETEKREVQEKEIDGEIEEEKYFERKIEKKKQVSKNSSSKGKILQILLILLAFLLTAGTVLLCWLSWIDLTEAGGIFFLILGGAVFGSRLLKKKKE